ncbi:hypothetical protein YYC_00026 [Plasmodium yoelii 17X]|uniref:Uncharacterized protein n=1 Tax=Plasmodium yoelii 17X TaxID=1323249 RepID=V7PXZ3_PLAYE|nr:hypothetical protein YYC_00026 [Plasmodium yoelii 17X]
MCNIVSNNENKNLNLMDNFNNNIFEQISGDSIPVSGTSVVSSIFGEEVSNPEKDMIEIKGNPEMKQDKSQHKQEPFMNTCILDKFDDFVVGFGKKSTNISTNALIGFNKISDIPESKLIPIALEKTEEPNTQIITSQPAIDEPQKDDINVISNSMTKQENPETAVKGNGTTEIGVLHSKNTKKMEFQL